MARLLRLVGPGRALKILVIADDRDGRRAELYGYVNRVIADDRLVDAVARDIRGPIRSYPGADLIEVIPTARRATAARRRCRRSRR
jgi:enoyl-CoA hydratase/carnithine racemase